MTILFGILVGVGAMAVLVAPPLWWAWLNHGAALVECHRRIYWAECDLGMIGDGGPIYCSCCGSKYCPCAKHSHRLPDGVLA